MRYRTDKRYLYEYLEIGGLDVERMCTGCGGEVKRGLNRYLGVMGVADAPFGCF